VIKQRLPPSNFERLSLSFLEQEVEQRGSRDATMVSGIYTQGCLYRGEPTDTSLRKRPSYPSNCAEYPCLDLLYLAYCWYVCNEGNKPIILCQSRFVLVDEKTTQDCCGKLFIDVQSSVFSGRRKSGRLLPRHSGNRRVGQLPGCPWKISPSSSKAVN
jgi:hypothetical protein